MPVLYQTVSDAERYSRPTVNLHLFHLGMAPEVEDNRRGDLVVVFEEVDRADEDSNQLRRAFLYRALVMYGNPDNDIHNQEVLYESPLRTDVRLLFATVVQQLRSCILLGSEETIDFDARRLRTRYWLRAVNDSNRGGDESYFLEGNWAGRPGNDREYRPLALGGRLGSGLTFSILCERQVIVGPDDISSQLVLLCVDATTLSVQRELVLQSNPTALWSSSIFEGRVKMTPFAFGPADGWVVAERSPDASRVTAFRVDSGCITSVSGALLPNLAALPTGGSIGEFAIAGGWARAVSVSPSGRSIGLTERNYLLAYEVRRPRIGTFVHSISFTWNSSRFRMSPPTAAPGLGQPRQHGITVRLTDLAWDSSTRCHWLCIDHAVNSARFSRLGHEGTAHVRDLLGPDTADTEVRVAFNDDDDESAFCWFRQNNGQNEVVTRHVLRPRSIRPLLSIGSGCPEIGPNVQSENDLLGADLRVNSAIAGHRYFTVTLTGAPPRTQVTLWIATRRGPDMSSDDGCAFQIDTADPTVVSIPAITDDSGAARVELRLDTSVFPDVFRRQIDFRVNSQIIRWNIPIVAQWSWAVREYVELDFDDDDRRWWGDDQPVGRIVQETLFGNSNLALIPIGSL